jgi:hypothetical protein
VVVSFGKKVFRTRIIRHSLNPVWDEKLLFHVRKYERSFRVQLTVLDWDKLSSNDHVGDAAIEIAELAENVPKRGPQHWALSRRRRRHAHFPGVQTAAGYSQGDAVGVEAFPDNHTPVSAVAPNCGSCA